MADNLTQVLTNYTIYIDSSSLMHGSMEFFKISLYNVLVGTKRKIKVVDFVIKDLTKKQFSDSEQYAVKALKILDFYRKKGLVEDIVTTGVENGKILDVIYNARNTDKNNVCVITENKELANEIIQNLGGKGVDFNHEIAGVRLINGPALWDIKTVKPRVMPIGKEKPLRSNISFDGIKPPSFANDDDLKELVEVQEDLVTEEVAKVEVEKEEIKVVEKEEIKTVEKETPFVPVNNTRVKRNKLVVSLVIDNSSSLTDKREEVVKKSLKLFGQKLQASDFSTDLDLAVYGFDGFSPRVIKGYDGELDINRFDNGGIQVLGKTITLAMDDLVERQKLYKEHNIETHKPWLIVLSDGGSYGDLTEVSGKLKNIVKSKKLTYFPFSLSTLPLEESMEPLAKLKMFLKIKDDQFDLLFDFLFNTLQTRINTPKNDSMTLDKKAISGFIAR